MVINDSGNGYTVYVQSNYYNDLQERMSKNNKIRGDKLGAPLTQEAKDASQDNDKLIALEKKGPYGGLDALIEKIADLIPELKGNAEKAM